MLRRHLLRLLFSTSVPTKSPNHFRNFAEGHSAFLKSLNTLVSHVNDQASPLGICLELDKLDVLYAFFTTEYRKYAQDYLKMSVK